MKKGYRRFVMVTVALIVLAVVIFYSNRLLLLPGISADMQPPASDLLSIYDASSIPTALPLDMQSALPDLPAPRPENRFDIVEDQALKLALTNLERKFDQQVEWYPNKKLLCRYFFVFIDYFDACIVVNGEVVFTPRTKQTKIESCGRIEELLAKSTDDTIADSEICADSKWVRKYRSARSNFLDSTRQLRDLLRQRGDRIGPPRVPGCRKKLSLGQLCPLKDMTFY